MNRRCIQDLLRHTCKIYWVWSECSCTFLLTRPMGACGKMERLVHHVSLVTRGRNRQRENQSCLSNAVSLLCSYIFCPNDTNDHRAQVEHGPLSYLHMSHLEA